MFKSHPNRRKSFWFFTVFTQFVLACVASADEPENIFFHESYNDAIREAQLTKKPIFLEFRCAP